MKQTQSTCRHLGSGSSAWKVCPLTGHILQGVFSVLYGYWHDALEALGACCRRQTVCHGDAPVCLEGIDAGSAHTGGKGANLVLTRLPAGMLQSQLPCKEVNTSHVCSLANAEQRALPMLQTCGV